jgi:hypothetical protein
MKNSKRPPEKFKKIVNKAVKDMRWQLGMQIYECPIVYTTEDRISDHLGMKIAATAQVDRRYLKCTFKIYPMMWQGWEDKGFSDHEVRKIIAHEVGHIATQHLYDIATAIYKDEGETRDAWESLTEIVGKLLVDGYEYAYHKK